MRRSILALSFICIISGLFALTVVSVSTTLTSVSVKSEAEAQPSVLAAFTAEPNLPDINAIFDLVNLERAREGAPLLVKDTQLTAIAEQRAQDMAIHSYYAHKGSDGKFFDQLAKEQGIAMQYGCENLDLQFSVMPEIYIKDWLNSKAGHRECLLDDRVTHAGYAVTQYAASGQAPNAPPTYIVIAIHAQP